jgi:hypothetical protein
MWIDGREVMSFQLEARRESEARRGGSAAESRRRRYGERRNGQP